MNKKAASLLVISLLILGALTGAAGYFEDEEAAKKESPERTERPPEEENGGGMTYSGLNGSPENRTKDRKYINKFHAPGEPRDWMLEEGNVSLQDPETPIYEVTRYPDAEPTKEDVNDSWRLYNRTYETVKEKGWFRYENAVEDGYVDYVLPDGLHHYNVTYFFDNESLNPEEPESLIYYTDPRNESRKILAGVMYEHIRKEGKQFGGPLTIWHYHPILPAKKNHAEEDLLPKTRFDSLQEVVDEYYEDPPEDALNKTGEMIHVWFVEHPGGPFGTGMSVPSESLEAVEGPKPEKMNETEFRRYIIGNYERRYSD